MKIVLFDIFVQFYFLQFLYNNKNHSIIGQLINKFKFTLFISLDFRNLQLTFNKGKRTIFCLKESFAKPSSQCKQ